jgi:hypothetical protein
MATKKTPKFSTRQLELDLFDDKCVAVPTEEWLSPADVTECNTSIPFEHYRAENLRKAAQIISRACYQQEYEVQKVLEDLFQYGKGFATHSVEDFMSLWDSYHCIEELDTDGAA